MEGCLLRPSATSRSLSDRGRSSGPTLAAKSLPPEPRVASEEHLLREDHPGVRGRRRRSFHPPVGEPPCFWATSRRRACPHNVASTQGERAPAAIPVPLRRAHPGRGAWSLRPAPGG